MAGKAQLLQRIAGFLQARGFSRVHTESDDRTARIAAEALAGLPYYDQLWSGELHGALQAIAIASGERLTGGEVARRAFLLGERAKALAARFGGEVRILQIVAYERPVPAEEWEFVVEEARAGSGWPFVRARVATWIYALGENAFHAGRFRGWPAELGADAFGALLTP